MNGQGPKGDAGFPALVSAVGKEDAISLNEIATLAHAFPNRWVSRHSNGGEIVSRSWAASSPGRPSLIAPLRLVG